MSGSEGPRSQIGANAAGRDALTASELRVAELAASGMTNRDIAQSLFVTQHTVETHPWARLPRSWGTPRG